MKAASEKPPITRNELLDKLAAECVEEILDATGRNGGESWFTIIRRKMAKLNEQEKP